MRLHSVPLALTFLLAIFACDDSVAPTPASVAGSYTATTFTVEVGGSVTDELAAGSSITLTLQTDGTTVGHILVPGGSEGGADLDEDLAGTWNLTGTTVTFAQNADTFIRDMGFTASTGKLSGMETFGGATITVVLEK